MLFLGPSLSRAEAQRLIEADIRPPAQRGHVHRAACEMPPLILLVDGAFETVPAVLHREILFALARGIPVAGAASLGALRAAELDRAGMVGLGDIYRAYREGRLDGDDEVALLHGPDELDYVPLSEPLVSIRATLAAAVDAGVIEEGARARTIADLKSRCFRERTVDAVAELAFPGDVPARREFVTWYRRTGSTRRRRTHASSSPRRRLADCPARARRAFFS